MNKPLLAVALLGGAAALLLLVPGTQAAFGGPDAGGYVWIDQAEPPMGPVAYVAPGAGWTSIGAPNDGLVTYNFPAGFGFEHYGNAQTRLFASDDGFITFTNTPGTTFVAQAVPDAAAPSNLIAPWWADHDLQCQYWSGTQFQFGSPPPTQPIRVVQQTAPDHLVVAWHDVGEWTDSQETCYSRNRFEAKLFNGTDISEAHVALADSDVPQSGVGGIAICRTATIGTENAGGTAGLRVAHADGTCATSITGSGRAVRFWRNDNVDATNQAVSVMQNAAVTFALSVSDDPLQYRLLGGPGVGTVTFLTSTSWPAPGAGVQYAPAVVTYTPPTGFSGTTSFTYEVRDGFDPAQQATVTITVQPLAQPPAALVPAPVVVEDSPAAFRLAGTDPEGDPLQVVPTDLPDFGTLTAGGVPLAVGTPIANDTLVVFTPDAHRVGADAFAFKVREASGAESPVLVVPLDVRHVNDAPVLSVAAVAVDEGAAATVPVADWRTAAATGPAAAIDEVDQTLTYSVVSSSPADAFAAPPAFDGALGLVLALSPDTNGPAAVVVRTCDDGRSRPGGTWMADPRCTDVTVPVAVAPVNDAPHATVLAGTATVLEGTPLARSVPWLSAAGVGGGPDEAAAQTLAFDVATTLVSGPPGLASPFAAPPTVDAAGNLVFTLADAGAWGEVDVTVTPRDQPDGLAGPPVTRRLHVLPVNDAPAFTPGGAVSVARGSDTTGLGDGWHHLPGWASGAHVGDPWEAADGQSLLGYTLTGFSAGLFASPPAVAADGTLSFRLAPGASGTTTGTVTLRDDGPGSAPHANVFGVPLAIEVFVVNTPPVAHDDAFSVYAGIGGVLDVLGNDVDADGDPLHATDPVIGAGLGTLDPVDDGLLYAPPEGFDGAFTFTYRAHDGQAASAPATVALDVVRPADPVVGIVASPVACRDVPLSVAVGGVQAGRVGTAWRLETDGRAFASDHDGDRVLFHVSYPAPGTYTLVATVRLAALADATDVVELSVAQDVEVLACVPPVVRFETFVRGLEVLFQDHSVDPDGVVAERHWDFGDGAVGTGPSPSHTYAAPGLYPVRLVVVDDEGSAAVLERVVSIEGAVVGEGGGGSGTGATSGGAGAATGAGALGGDPEAPDAGTAPVNRRPEARAAAPARTTAGASVVLDASASRDADADPLRFRWVQTAGPAVVLLHADAARAEFLGARPGQYAFRVVVADGHAAEEATVAVEVLAPAPAATGFSAQADGRTVRFAGPPAQEVLWDFGDGHTSRDAAPAHDYAAPGTYRVRLLADGAETLQTVTVAEDAPADGPAQLQEARPAATAAVPTLGWVLLGVLAAVGLGLLAALAMKARRGG